MPNILRDIKTVLSRRNSQVLTTFCNDRKPKQIDVARYKDRTAQNKSKMYNICTEQTTASTQCLKQLNDATALIQISSRVIDKLLCFQTSRRKQDSDPAISQNLAWISRAFFLLFKLQSPMIHQYHGKIPKEKSKHALN